ncbi:MAG: hypothetical protein ABI783_11320 [Actinomycetota bacterium]
MMTGRRLAGVVALAAALLLAPAATARAASLEPVSIVVNRVSITTKLGHKFAFRSTVENRSSTAASGLIAHLNVLSLRDGVYVDPEDWSSKRTYYLAPIPAGNSTTITWKMQAVNAGEFGVYVAVLRRSGVALPPTTGPTIHLSIAKRTTLNSGGILPLALGIPALLGFVWLGLRARRRRGSSRSHLTDLG